MTLVSLVLAAPPARAASVAVEEPAPPRGSAAAPCDSSTALTLLGVDSESKRLLLSAPATAPGVGSWLLELDAAGDHATLHPTPANEVRIGGSIGPGPVITALACGRDCVRVERWNAGAWQPVGEPISIASTMAFAGTWDRGGAPWAMLHRLTGPGGQAQGWAYRLEGGEWLSKGSLEVAAVGTPAVRPAPDRTDAVVSGSGRFAARRGPQPWIVGRPRVAPGKHGQLVPLAGTAAAYIALDGAVYLSQDSGATWRQSMWTPWESGTTQVRRRGGDYSVDVPVGSGGRNLHLLWFEVTANAVQNLLISESTAADLVGTPRIVLETPAFVPTAAGERLEVTDVVRWDDGSWLLFSGCVGVRGGGALVYRTADRAGTGAPLIVPLQPAAR